MTRYLLETDKDLRRLVPENTSLPMTDADAYNLATWELRNEPLGWAEVLRIDPGPGDETPICTRDVHGRWDVARMR